MGRLIRGLQCNAPTPDPSREREGELKDVRAARRKRAAAERGMDAIQRDEGQRDEGQRGEAVFRVMVRTARSC
jgi:hypothetical protein